MLERGECMPVQLCVRSHYSLLNGTMSVEELVITAKERGYHSLALTEHRVMFSALEFANVSLKHGIKPIYGLEVRIDAYSSLLLAKNIKGFKTLNRLSMMLSSDDAIQISDFIEDIDNLVFIVYGESGPLDGSVTKNNWESVALELRNLKQKAGEFYVGLSHQESRFFEHANRTIKEICDQLEVKCVALPKVYYKNKDDHDLFRALQAIDAGTHINDQTLNLDPERWMISASEMSKLYEEELVRNTDRIADICNVDLLEIKTELPVFQNNQDVTNAIYLSELSRFGLSKRLGTSVSKHYKSRLDYELNVINSMNFTDYFLIVYDVIRYAKQAGINVGPGRGSAAGSLVAYSLGITDVDPISYGLVFERFLNPERISMPDIDIDFPDNKRDQVIDYARMKYGDAHIAHIISFGTLKAKQSFRDAARVLQIPISKVNQVARLLSNDKLETTYKKSSKLRMMIDGDELTKQAFDLAIRLEDKPRHVTVHAGGIVMSKQPLLDVCALYKVSEDVQCIQYDMTRIESIGLIKIDFLGIRNLTIISNIVDKIKETNPQFDIKKIPLNDVDTFELLGNAETVGIFQLESDGMKSLLKRLKPQKFMDIVDANALFRPGPMENIPEYLRNRSNPSQIEYIHHDLQEITKNTYGVLIYQEQIMEVARKFGGFSLGKADILRRAMGKKDALILTGLKKEFIDGSLTNGYTLDIAEKIFDLIFKFANYGFNKSHSVVYSYISYQLAYLKANYATTFYTYILTSVIGSDQKTSQYLDECKKRNVGMLSININSSTDEYLLEGNKIRMPFTIIKGISGNISKTIIAERIEHGQYLSISQAIARLISVKITRKQIESLVDAGAFDFYGYNRSSVHDSLDELIQYGELVRVHDPSVRFDFGLVSEPIMTETVARPADVLKREMDALGFYFSEHPTTALKRKHDMMSIINLEVSDKPVRIIALIDRIKPHRAKNGAMMSFLNISDDSGIMDAVVFPNVYRKFEESLRIGDIVLIQGVVKEQGSIIVSNMVIFKESDLLQQARQSDI